MMKLGEVLKEAKKIIIICECVETLLQLLT